MWWAFLSCAKTVAPAPPPEIAAPAPTEADATRGVASPLLRAVVGEHWDATMARYPTWASRLGDHRFDDRLFDPSTEARRAWLRRQQQWALRLSALPDASLSPSDRLTRDLLLQELRDALALEVCRFEQWSVSARDNAWVELQELGEQATWTDPRAEAAYLARLAAFPALVDGATADLRRGLAEGWVANRESVARVVAMLDAGLATPTAGWSAVAPEGAPPEVAGRLRAAALPALEEGVRPALTRYRDLLRDEILPVARVEPPGLVGLPEGEACYRATIRAHTTLDGDPERLHQTGLDELQRIHAEFRALGAAALGTDDLPAIFERLRTDPALYFATGEEILAAAEGALRRAEAAAPTLFGQVPSAPCVVQPVPDYLAPYTTVAYYQPVRPDGSKPGVYFVNTWEPSTRPRHEAEVLAFHESVPGHHLQIASARALGELPAFRRYGQVTAFVEGWALYVERLADEAGLYGSDLDRLGMLSFDAWRASRLVVDTGLHHRGWTRAQAEAFLLENTPLAPNNVVNEVDRYLTTPGQALAYKVGQLEIRRLRAEAEAALGPSFSLPAFHDRLLGAGALPLPVLADRIEGWIRAAEEG